MKTDGPFCPSLVYGANEARRCSGFSRTSGRKSGIQRRSLAFHSEGHSRRVGEMVGRRWGWHRMIYGEKGLTAPPIEWVLKALDAIVRWLTRLARPRSIIKSFYAGPFGAGEQRRSITETAWSVLRRRPYWSSARRFAPGPDGSFHRRFDFPLQMPYYAMGHKLPVRDYGTRRDLTRAIHFLNSSRTRAVPASKNTAGAIPTTGSLGNGIIKEGTPLITKHPLRLRGFLTCCFAPSTSAQRIADENATSGTRLRSRFGRQRPRHIRDFKISATASSCFVYPFEWWRSSSTRRRIGHFC